MKPFLFVVFREETPGGRRVLVDGEALAHAGGDLEGEVRRVWNETVRRIGDGRADDLPREARAQSVTSGHMGETARTPCRRRGTANWSGRASGSIAEHRAGPGGQVSLDRWIARTRSYAAGLQSPQCAEQCCSDSRKTVKPPLWLTKSERKMNP